MMLLKWCTPYKQTWKPQHWPQGLEKVSFHSNSKERQCQRMFKYCTSALISLASKVMLKILQARLQQYVNGELPDIQAGFRKRQRNQRSNCQHLLDHSKSKGIPEKHLFLLHWLCGWSVWLGGLQQTVENSERDGHMRPPDLPLEKPICRSGGNS